MTFERKSEGKRLLGSPRRRWGENNKMNYREIGLGVIEWIDLTENKDQ
jgi:hypothetical protein